MKPCFEGRTGFIKNVLIVLEVQNMFVPSLERSSKKSVLRSIRVSDSLATRLEEDARESGISLNSLVASVLERYEAWDKVADKFGFVHVSSELFGQMLNALDERSVVRMARDSGRNLSTDLISFWFKEVTLNSVLSYIDQLSKYQRLCTVETAESKGKLVIIVHHSLGEKGSVWFMNFLSETLKANLDIDPTVRQTRSSVRFEIPLNTSRATPHEPGYEPIARPE